MLTYQLTKSQTKFTLPTRIELELTKLINYKHQYEKFKLYAVKYPGKYKQSTDSSYSNYLAQIQLIKNNPNDYLKFINREINKPELEKEKILYSYVEKKGPFDPNLYLISKRDVYRVIKYTLLERDAKILPETLNDIPFKTKRDYNKTFKLQKVEDILKDDSKK